MTFSRNTFSSNQERIVCPETKNSIEFKNYGGNYNLAHTFHAAAPTLSNERVGRVGTASLQELTKPQNYTLWVATRSRLITAAFNGAAGPAGAYASEIVKRL
jgi:hypothetical protein